VHRTDIERDKDRMYSYIDYEIYEIKINRGGRGEDKKI